MTAAKSTWRAGIRRMMELCLECPRAACELETREVDACAIHRADPRAYNAALEELRFEERARQKAEWYRANAEAYRARRRARYAAAKGAR